MFSAVFQSLARLTAASATLLLACPAIAAPADLFAPETVSAVLDARLVGADGERSWTAGGFGKARLGGDEGEFEVHPVLAEGQAVWHPPLGWNLTGTLVVAAQHRQDEPVDISEAFLTYKPLPRGNFRFSARAGLYWPAISLEHEGAAWLVSDMVTPSAINSWIGEEVKVVGIEATAAQDLGSGRLAGTIGLFGVNDTAGTLLAFRGWALHDLKATAFSTLPLPGLNEMIRDAQAPVTRPLIELDERLGYYAKLSWQVSPALLIEAFHYNNRGDPEAVTETLQWGWETRFWHVGTRLDLTENTRLLAQAMTGTTEMGPEDEFDRYWVETRFRAAYLRLSHDRGPLTFSARADLFDTSESGAWMEAEDEREEGWALAGDIAWRVSDKSRLLVEGLHISSERGARRRDGLDARQRQTVLQAALRLTF
jgi:hypothetical protein